MLEHVECDYGIERTRMKRQPMCVAHDIRVALGVIADLDDAIASDRARARADHEPHVFDTVPETPGLVATIRRHLGLITDMQSWEQTNERMLQAG